MDTEYSMQETSHQANGQSQEHTKNTSLIVRQHDHQAAESANQSLMTDRTKHQFCPGAGLVHTNGISNQCTTNHTDNAKQNIIGNRKQLCQIVSDFKTRQASKQRCRRTCGNAADGNTTKAQ